MAALAALSEPEETDPPSPRLRRTHRAPDLSKSWKRRRIRKRIRNRIAVESRKRNRSSRKRR